MACLCQLCLLKEKQSKSLTKSSIFFKLKKTIVFLNNVSHVLMIAENKNELSQ